MAFLLASEAIPALEEVETIGQSLVSETLDLSKGTEALSTSTQSGLTQKVIAGATATATGLDAYEHYKSQQDQNEANEAITKTLEAKTGNSLSTYPSAPIQSQPLNYNSNPIYNVPAPSIPISSGSVLQTGYQGAGIA